MAGCDRCQMLLGAMGAHARGAVPPRTERSPRRWLAWAVPLTGGGHGNSHLDCGAEAVKAPRPVTGGRERRAAEFAFARHAGVPGAEGRSRITAGVTTAPSSAPPAAGGQGGL